MLNALQNEKVSFAIYLLDLIKNLKYNLINNNII